MSEPEVYGVVVEFHNQAPLLMEMEGQGSSLDAAMEYARRFGGGRAIRWCVVKLTYQDGNELLLKDMERMQK